MNIETSYNTSGNKSSPDDYSKYLLSKKKEFNVTRVSFIDGFSEVDLPVAIAYRPNSKVLSQSGGKGISRNQALISALMESYECDSAEKIKPDLLKTSIDELKTKNLDYLDPTSLPTTLTYFEENLPIDWIYGENLFNGRRLLVPFESVSVDFTRMASLEFPTYQQLTSNGLASGYSEKDAIFSAIYELIERHSVTTNEFNGSTMNKPIDQLSVPSDIRKNCLDKIALGNLDLEIYDVSIFDVFPTYACYLTDYDGMTSVGWGCSNSSSIALLRAVTEANQARTILLSGSREDMHKYDYLLARRIIDDNNNIMSKNNNNSINYRNIDEAKINTFEDLKNIFKIYNLQDPIFITLDKQDHMAAVRVIVPKLHGYNYPAYQSIIDDKFCEDLLRYQKTDTHLPAAI